MGIDSQPFGQTLEQAPVDLYVLTNDHGMTVEIMTYGATLTAVRVPDRRGKAEHVTLYLERLEDYLGAYGPPQSPEKVTITNGGSKTGIDFTLQQGFGGTP